MCEDSDEVIKLHHCTPLHDRQSDIYTMLLSTAQTVLAIEDYIET